MTRTPQGIRVLGNVIPQHPTLSNMSRTELTFALLVEEVILNSTKEFPTLLIVFSDVESYTATGISPIDSRTAFCYIYNINEKSGIDF